jgi:hypothetical protein
MKSVNSETLGTSVNRLYCASRPIELAVRCNSELGVIFANTANPFGSTRTTRPRVFNVAPGPAASNRGKENSICRMLPITNLLRETINAPETLQSRVWPLPR